MLNDPERFRGHDPNLNPGGEFIFLPVFLRRLNSYNVDKGRNGLWIAVLVSVVHFVAFVRDNIS
ncbi:MAG: hypothetical protein DMF30_02825 [Verrucomicrobia bacterium]|nr:MAG: hypothetical protein DMF30_02825 [Verrucomicrobiota bacterium]